VGNWGRETCAVILLLCVPAVIVPGGYNRFVFGKLLVGALGVLLAFRSPPVGMMGKSARVLLAVASLALVVSALASTSPSTALLGRDPQIEGVPVLGLYLLAGLSGGRVLGPARSERVTRVAVATMAVTVIVVAGLAILEAVGLRPLSSNVARPGSLLGNASDEGALAVLYAGPLIADALKRRGWLVVLGASASLLTVVLSLSRGAMVGLVATAVLLGAFMGRHYRRAVVAGGIALVSLVMAVPSARNRVLGISPLSRATVSGRLLLWRETLRLVARHPILGVGPSQFENAIVAEHTLQWQQKVGPANPPGSPHDLVLQALMAGGVVLVGAAGGIAVLAARNALSAHRKAPDDTWMAGCLAGLGGYAVALMFHLTSPGTTIPAAVIGGSLLAVTPATRHRLRTEASVRIVLPAISLFMAIVFAGGAAAEICLQQGHVEVARGNLGSANSDYLLARDLLAWDPDLPGQVLHSFVAIALAGDKSAVIYATAWSRRVGLLAGDEQILEDRATLLEVAGHYSSSQRLVANQLRIDPYNPMLLLLQGVDDAQLHQYANAQASLLEATKVDPSDPNPWTDLAALYRAEQQPSMASQASARAKRLASRLG